MKCKNFFTQMFDNKEKFADKLKSQADKKNSEDLKNILNELEEASQAGEYVKIISLKINQASYVESLGLKVEKTERFDYYKISWL